MEVLNISNPNNFSGLMKVLKMSPNVEDRLTILPEEIISHILSLMPMIFAVQTCILSKRFRNIWKLVTNLDFDVTSIKTPSLNSNSLTIFVDRVLQHCITSQIKLCRVVFPRCAVKGSSVSRWIDIAVALGVSELELRAIRHELPLSFYTCTRLTKLRLDICFYEWECPSFVNFPFLKSLEVVVLKTPFANAFKLINSCLVLESLYFQTIFGNEEVCVFNIQTLKRLELQMGLDRQEDVNKVVLNVPNLEYLFVKGSLCSLFVMEDLSSLVEASSGFVKHDHLLVELLKGVNGVKTLTLNHIPSTLRLPLSVFPNVKRLELNVVRKYTLISKFLDSCPELEHLCIENENPYKDSWIEPKLVPTCMLTNLTSIKISYCNGHQSEMQFLKYILTNAKVLKKLTIIPLSTKDVESWLCAQLVKVPRASPNCVILFRGMYFNGLPLG